MTTEATAIRAIGSSFREQFTKQFNVANPILGPVSFASISDAALGSFVLLVVHRAGMHGVMIDAGSYLSIGVEKPETK
jgi:hypothetical protein